MQGIYLRFYVQESRQHGILDCERLLEEARKVGIHGGSAFRTVVGGGAQGFADGRAMGAARCSSSVTITRPGTGKVLPDEATMPPLRLDRRRGLRRF